MAYEERTQRQMHTGNWTCASCGGPITELPFDPDPSRLDHLRCRDCHRKSAAPRRDSAPREMFSGNWTCASCGGSITELPFQPDPAKLGQLQCRDCHRSRTASR